MSSLRRGSFAVFCIGIAVALGSCATIDREGCQTSDWAELGVADAFKGRKADWVENYVKDCAEHGLPVDTERYAFGWNYAIREFCTREIGYRVGLRGLQYQDTCPADLAPDFIPAYRAGKRIDFAESGLRSAEYRLEDLDRQLDDDDLHPEIRKQLRDKHRRVREEYRYYQESLRDAEEAAIREGFPVE